MRKKKENDINEEQLPLSEEELKMLKSSIAAEKVDRSRLPHYDNSDRAKLFRYVKNNKVFVISAIAVAVCIIATVIACIAVTLSRVSEGENTSDFEITVGDDKYTAKYKDVVRNGAVYVDLRIIAEYASLIVTGDDTNVKFTLSDTQYIRVEDGSDEAVVNGSLVSLGGKAEVSSERCMVPYSFFDKVLGEKNGIKMILDKQNNTLIIGKMKYKTEDGYRDVELVFRTDEFEIITGIVRDEGKIEYEYPINIEQYIDSISPADKNAYLLLVNKKNALGENYAPEDLRAIESLTKPGEKLYLRADAERALYAMMLEMKRAGITDTFVTSAYRDYKYQVGLFNFYVNKHMNEEGMTKKEAEKAALEYSAKPGTSEHQSGLCIDFMTNSMSELDETFALTKAFEWLSKNAYKYGFILRYPADKVDITEYKYEPWHYRFVGREAATEIWSSGLCLEEYLELN